MKSVIAALLVLCLAAPSAFAADDVDRMIRFSQLHGTTWLFEEARGKLEVYINAAGETHVRGAMQGKPFASEGAGAVLQHQPLAAVMGKPCLKFQGPSFSLMLITGHSVKTMSAADRASWLAKAPGCIVAQGADFVMPTAALGQSPQGTMILAAFADAIPLK